MGDGVNDRPRAPRTSDGVILGAFAVATLLLHFACNSRYGYWIDELYFIACSEHLAWGYVDHPPLIAFIARGSRALLGNSLFAIRFLPAVAHAALVFLAGWITRMLGGHRFAQVLAAVAVALAPVYLAFGNLLTMNAFEPVLWTACTFLVMRMVERERPQLWLVVGVLGGIGLLNKHSMAFFGLALIAGLLLTPERRVLRSTWIGVAGLVALVIVVPHVWWQIENRWPTLELLRNAQLYQHQSVSAAQFVWGQIQLLNPLALPLWLAGLYFYVAEEQGRRFRFVGWTFVLLFVGGMIIEAKTYYLAPAYPMLLAAGAVAIERWAGLRWWRWLKPATLALVVIGAVPTLPYVLPILPIEMVPGYLEWLGMREVRPERRAVGDVPQLFADMFGWDETVAAVAKAYGNLPPEERARAAIWGVGYGEAAAVDLLGPPYGLPPAISGHQNYFLWGPRDASGEVLVAVRIPQKWLQPWCTQLDEVEVVECRYCMPDRQRIAVSICRGLKVPLTELWPKVKCWTCDRPEIGR